MRSFFNWFNNGILLDINIFLFKSSSSPIEEEFRLRGFPRLLGGREPEVCRKLRYENFMISWKSVETRAYVRTKYIGKNKACLSL
jgi:hypothetical protein